MSDSASREFVQTLYIAYYGRPADPQGLNFWCDRVDQLQGELAEIVGAFGVSQEFHENFGNLADAELINNLFRQVFGREAEPAGLDFYLDLLASGSRSLASIALDIANGAKGDDLTILNNRLQVADTFTASIDERQASYGPNQIEAVKDVLTQVDATPDSIATATLYYSRLIESFLGNPGTIDDFVGDQTTTSELTLDAALSGRIEALGDEDWFSVELQAGALYSVAMNGDSDDPVSEQTPSLLLRVYDSGASTLYDAAGFGPNPERALEFTTDETGTYFIAVAAQNYWLGDYDLSLSLIALADDYAAAANTLGRVDVDDSTTGRIEVAGDEDWFRADLASGTVYSLSLTGLGEQSGSASNASLQLLIHDGQGDPIGEAEIGTGDSPNAVVEFSPTNSEAYFIAAKGLNDWRGEYQLMVQALPPDDDFPGDISTSGSLAVGGGQVNGAVQFAGDRDWFSVSLTAGVEYEFELRGTDSVAGTLADPEIRLHDSNGGFLVDDDNGGQGLDARLGFVAAQSGTYFVSAGSATSTGQGSYALSADVVEEDEPGDGGGPGIGDFGPGFGDVYVIGDLSNFMAGPRLIDTPGDIDTLALLDGAFETTPQLTLTESIDLQVIEQAVVVAGTPAFDFDFLDLSAVTSSVTTNGLSVTSDATDDAVIVGRFDDYSSAAAVAVRGFGALWLSANTEGSEFEIDHTVNQIQDGTGLKLVSFDSVNTFNASKVSDRGLSITVVDQLGVDTTVVGGDGADTLTGALGDDLLIGGPGPDLLDGGRVDEVHVFDLAGTTLDPTADFSIAIGDSVSVTLTEGVEIPAGADVDQLGYALQGADWSAATFDHDSTGGTAELSFSELVKSVEYDSFNNELIFRFRSEIRDADAGALNLRVAVADASAAVTIEGLAANVTGVRDPFISFANSIDATDSADTYRFLTGADSTRSSVDAVAHFDASDDIDVLALLDDLTGDTDTPLDKGLVDFAALTEVGFFGGNALAFGNDGSDSRLWIDSDGNGNLDNDDFELIVEDYLISAGDISRTFTGTSGAEVMNSGKTSDLLRPLAGADTVIPGTGTDRIELGPADSAVDLIDFDGASDLKRIDGFESGFDQFSFNGLLIGSGTGSPLTATSGTALVAGTVVPGALVPDRVYVVDDGINALTAGGVESLVDYRNRADVAAYLGEAFTSTAAGDTAVFVINDSVSETTFVFLFDEDAGNVAFAVDAGDLTLIGVVTELTAQPLVAAEIV